MKKLNVSDLYLYYRQAKICLFFERRNVGMTRLANYEKRLGQNLNELLRHLSENTWFDGTKVGDVWVVPKRLDTQSAPDGTLVKHGFKKTEKGNLEVQVWLSPTPNFAILEMMYLRKFGSFLDSICGGYALGNRLDLKNGILSADRRWVFKYWPKEYNKFRDTPLVSAKRYCDEGVAIVSADLASFYDSIDPTFLLQDSFISRLEHTGFDKEDYILATKSLLNAYERFRKTASKRLGVRLKRGIPIGSLVSKVISNVALEPLDSYILSHPQIIDYKRYVDDIVFVAKYNDGTVEDIIREFFPTEKNDFYQLNSKRLGRPGSNLRLQEKKLKIHILKGEPGKDFIEWVQNDFTKLISRNNSFIDDTVFKLEDSVNLNQSEPITVLRDADKIKHERFSISINLRSLERISSLVHPSEAQTKLQAFLKRPELTQNAMGNWVENLETNFRTLKLAIRVADWELFETLNKNLDERFGDVEALDVNIDSILFCGDVVSSKNAWKWLRNFLHERRKEAVVSVLPLEKNESEIFIKYRDITLEYSKLLETATNYAIADLRGYDREDDSSIQYPKWKIEKELETNSAELNARFSQIAEFLETAKNLSDQKWTMQPSRLFLCTRPPSYFDIARRMLYRVEKNGFSEEIFESLLDSTNAIRGTKYSEPIGHVRDEHTIYFPSEKRDPNIVLGNLYLTPKYWKKSLTNDPERSIERLRDLSNLIEETKKKASSDAPTLLVLPELAIPRTWLRYMGTHIVKFCEFGAVFGVEYLREAGNKVTNQAITILPGPFQSVATWPWTKRRPASGEKSYLLNEGLAFSYRKYHSRFVVETDWGRFSVLICSELIEVKQIASLLGRVELIICPAWNPDTSTYDHLIQTVGFQLNAIVAIANSGYYSDCRVWAPRAVRWQRNLCRLINRESSQIISVTLPIQNLLKFRREHVSGNSPFTISEKPKEKTENDWRPLPPDWPS